MTISYRIEFKHPLPGGRISARVNNGAELDAVLYEYYQQGGDLREVKVHAVANLGGGNTNRKKEAR